MSLTPGTRLGPYEIVAPLGEGGPPALNAVFDRSYGEVPPKPNPRPRP